MAVFDESKVINALHPEKAEIGKKYWVSDYILCLKERVKNNDIIFTDELIDINKGNDYCFCTTTSKYELLYPYEEPPKKRMTNRQLAELLSKKFGQFKRTDISHHVHYCEWDYLADEENDEVPKNIAIRSWDSDEWVEPTVDIYEGYCKGGKNER